MRHCHNISKPMIRNYTTRPKEIEQLVRSQLLDRFGQLLPTPNMLPVRLCVGKQ